MTTPTEDTGIVLDEAEIERLNAEWAELRIERDAADARISEIVAALVASGEARWARDGKLGPDSRQAEYERYIHGQPGIRP